MKSSEVRLKAWPVGLPKHDDFEIVEVEVPAIGPGELLIRNVAMSVDPYMRGRLRSGKSYVASFSIGEPLSGGCVGIVEESGSNKIARESRVLHGKGFREYSVVSEDEVTLIDDGTPMSAHLGVLGMPGRTAYVGLKKFGLPVAGETIFVTAAAGAVGSAGCQIAKILGLRVIASAGSDAKVRFLLDDAGVDAAFNYRNFMNVSRELRRLAPDGIDIYFDNVGGIQLEAAINGMNDYGRIVCCGMISTYNDTAPVPGPANLVKLVGKRIRMQGFIVSDHPEYEDDFDREMKSWIADGRVVWRETVHEGIDETVDALIGLFTGENIGKMVVRLSDEPE